MIAARMSRAASFIVIISTMTSYVLIAARRLMPMRVIGIRTYRRTLRPGASMPAIIARLIVGIEHFGAISITCHAAYLTHISRAMEKNVHIFAYIGFYALVDDGRARH